jgi:D-alanyl-lipoteichoic acid acyltransferase DltB (MBOAT superfamily)
MITLLRLLVPFIVFPAVSALVLRYSPVSARLKLFALVNVVGAFGLLLLNPMRGLYFWLLPAFLEIGIPVFLVYLATVVIHYRLVRAFAMKTGWIPWAAFLFPVIVMLVVKYVPWLSEPLRAQLGSVGRSSVTDFFLGISYMAFRLSYLVVEVRNGIVEMPTVWEHLAFAFFVPTLTIGPISRYSVFRESVHNPNRDVTPLGRSAMRILVGITKYLFLASMIEQLSYSGLLMDSHIHPRIDLLVAAVAFYIYLYLNFSGYCDMAIGTAGLIGIKVDENFDHPFRSRNMQEYWTRWHITLSHYMRDTVFSPLSKALIRRFGPGFTNHAIAISVFVVFILIGAWHGLTWNFLIFGAIHGVGVASCHYYTVWLKKVLGKKGYAAYERNPYIRAAGVTLTFAYATVALFFFANGLDAEREIMKLLR